MDKYYLKIEIKYSYYTSEERNGYKNIVNDYVPGNVDSILSCLDNSIREIETFERAIKRIRESGCSIKISDSTVRFVRENGSIIDEIGGDFFNKIKDSYRIISLMCML